MDLGNSVKIVMHYLLIRGMTCLDHWDDFSYGECTNVYGYILDKTYNEL